MLPLKRILCSIDFSDVSYQALEAAIQLAKDFDAELCLLHIAAPVGREFGVEAYGAVEADAENVVAARNRLAELIAARVPEGVRTRTLNRLGNAASEIESAVKEEDADLLVIATRGLTGWRHLVFGSVTERTVRMASCPVLAIHDREDEKEKNSILPFRKILCPTDFSEPSRLAVATASELAGHYGAMLALLHVTWTTSNRLPSGEYEIASYDQLKMSEAHAKLCELIAESTPFTAHAHPFVRMGNTAEEIERAAEAEDADLIVIATHGTSGWHRMFYGSVAEQVLRVTKFPILVVHAPSPVLNSKARVVG